MRNKRIHLVYGILTGVSAVVAGVCLAVACVGIYRSGPKPFTRQSIADAFSSVFLLDKDLFQPDDIVIYPADTIAHISSVIGHRKYRIAFAYIILELVHSVIHIIADVFAFRFCESLPELNGKISQGIFLCHIIHTFL